MRLIKFRGIDTMSGEMVYGDLVQQKLTDRNTTTAIVQTYATYDVKPETVGQFTGLHDKNGKEIYEGDILSVLGCFTAKEMLTNFHVEHVEKKGAFGMLLKVGGFVSVASLFKVRGLETDVVITGNIHDNPELKKK